MSAAVDGEVPIDSPLPFLETKRRPRPSDYPCPAGRGGHYMLSERRAGVLIPSCALDGGPIIWVCVWCGLRFQTGIGAVA